MTEKYSGKGFLDDIEALLLKGPCGLCSTSVSCVPFSLATNGLALTATVLCKARKAVATFDSNIRLASKPLLYSCFPIMMNQYRSCYKSFY